MLCSRRGDNRIGLPSGGLLAAKLGQANEVRRTTAVRGDPRWFFNAVPMLHGSPNQGPPNEECRSPHSEACTFAYCGRISRVSRGKANRPAASSTTLTWQV